MFEKHITPGGIDFSDGTAGIKHFDALLRAQGGTTCVATVVVRFAAFKRTKGRDALLDFIRELFSDMDVLYGADEHESDMLFYDRNAAVHGRADAILDKCVVLNTYFKHYFYPTGEVVGFCIYYGLHEANDKLLAFSFANYYDASADCLVINDLVRRNSAAGSRLNKFKRKGSDAADEDVYDYDVELPELARTLDKLAR